MIENRIKENKYIKIFTIAALILFMFSFTIWGCSKNNRTISANIDNRSETEKNSGEFYEGVFIDANDIKNVLKEVRGENAPYEHIQNYCHVTLFYRPEDKHNNLYGQEVDVHLLTYKNGSVELEDNTVTHNEGIKVELHSDNEELQQLIDELSQNQKFHITATYEGLAKYTGKLDYSNGVPLDIHVKGYFGLCSDNDLQLQP